MADAVRVKCPDCPHEFVAPGAPCKSERRHVESLRRRLSWLDKRLRTQEERGEGVHTFDMSERRALKWAIKALTGEEA
jgi:hypothetical protein